ncbi:MogA/MoaB family molybdenum cofactor biosynthesis protein [Gulosibacter bifidus]|uniref:Molybdenum cofactor biosynthesis protein B n=1 Tax=Gulosibacter bifidus TaxID=272239 RepID=A0ABW5RLU6_9MICO|nr:MogA/MoaB family molybdenum cofactor biosynthesis protein [Gulosibacter bifidus]
MHNEVNAAVITVSDRSARGERADASGPAMVATLAARGIHATGPVVVPDAVDAIQAAVRQALAAGAQLVLLTGGTGIAPRDVTGAALAPLLDERIPGIEEALRARGLATGAPGAMLSRPVAGIIRDARALCIAGPGSRGGARDTAEIAADIAAHALAQLRGDGESGHQPPIATTPNTDARPSATPHDATTTTPNSGHEL